MTAAFVRSRLFRPFRSTKSDGVGLGLYTARQIVRFHGGEIRVVERAGRGDSRPDHASPGGRDVVTTGGRVAIVEDDAVLLDQLTWALRERSRSSAARTAGRGASRSSSRTRTSSSSTFASRRRTRRRRGSRSSRSIRQSKARRHGRRHVGRGRSALGAQGARAGRLRLLPEAPRHATSSSSSSKRALERHRILAGEPCAPGGGACAASRSGELVGVERADAAALRGDREGRGLRRDRPPRRARAARARSSSPEALHREQPAERTARSSRSTARPSRRRSPSRSSSATRGAPSPEPSRRGPGSSSWRTGGRFSSTRSRPCRPRSRRSSSARSRAREIERVGGRKPISVDIRLVAASNEDLEGRVAAGAFREDLFYRINTVVLRLPPLRERLDDLPLLVDFFAARSAEPHGRPPKTVLAPRSLELFRRPPVAWERPRARAPRRDADADGRRGRDPPGPPAGSVRGERPAGRSRTGFRCPRPWPGSRRGSSNRRSPGRTGSRRARRRRSASTRTR